jgi:hypothetical protein
MKSENDQLNSENNIIKNNLSQIQVSKSKILLQIRV